MFAADPTQDHTLGSLPTGRLTDALATLGAHADTFTAGHVVGRGSESALAATRRTVAALRAAHV